MIFQFSRQGLSGRDRLLERLFEIAPGAASWIALLGMAVLGIWRPLIAAVLIIAFDLYWFLRLFYMTVFLALSYFLLSVEKTTDWASRVKALDRLEPSAGERPRGIRGTSLKAQMSHVMHRRRLGILQHSAHRPPASTEIRHVVIVPIFKEARSVFEPSIQSLAHQQLSPKQILVILAVEERASADVHEAALAVQQRYRDVFLDFLVAFHPDGRPGEARVKGANATYAAKEAATYLTTRGIPFDHVVVSCFDADTVVGPEYFACLTYHFMACPNRTRASFQPIPVYHNNIWDVPGFARVLDIGSSFFQLIEATNPEKLVTFSSHSMSFQALVEIGYWPVDMISDDSAIFWKAFIYYDSDYTVVPMYVTVSMDVVAADSWRNTVANVYKQKRRWAWGVENFPIVMRAFLRAPFSLTKKLTHGFKLFEDHVAWATWPFLLGVIGWFPALFAGREFSSSVMYYSAPRIAVTIFHLASIGLLASIALSVCLLPRAPVKRPWLKKLGHMLEWLFVPVIAVFLSAIPALDAQTKLMLGHYLEFWSAEKTR